MKWLTAWWNSDRFWLISGGANLGWAMNAVSQGDWIGVAFNGAVGAVLIWAHWELPNMKLLTLETPSFWYRTKVVRK